MLADRHSPPRPMLGCYARTQPGAGHLALIKMPSVLLMQDSLALQSNADAVESSCACRPSMRPHGRIIYGHRATDACNSTIGEELLILDLFLIFLHGCKLCLKCCIIRSTIITLRLACLKHNCVVIHCTANRLKQSTV